MIKGLGHLIRIVFGGRQPAPALPSHTTGDVEAEAVQPPLASDDVLRRAMEAAGEAEGEGAAAAVTGPRYEPPPIEEIGSLPTLFLHGKPSGPQSPDEAAPDETVPDEVSEVAEAIGVEPVLQHVETPEPLQEADVGAFMPDESVAQAPDALHASISYEEIDFAPRASDLILFGREFATHVERVMRVAAPLPVKSVEASAVPVASIEDPVLEMQADSGPWSETQVSDELPGTAPADDIVEDVLASTEAAIVEASSEDEPVADMALAQEAARKPARRKAEPGTTTRRKKSVKALPEDAVWLTDAVIWTQCGSWREFWLPPTDPESSARVEEFRLLAAEGQLTVWGRTGEALEWTPIAASHWKKAGFDPLAFLAGRENAFSQAPVKKSRTKPPADPVRFSSLMVSKSAVEAIWAARSASEAAVA